MHLLHPVTDQGATKHGHPSWGQFIRVNIWQTQSGRSSESILSKECLNQTLSWQILQLSGQGDARAIHRIQGMLSSHQMNDTLKFKDNL